MKNTKSSVIIEDLAPLSSENIQDLSQSEINNISGGMTFLFSYNSTDGESYTYIDDNGEITEKGTRPENFEPDVSTVSFAPVFTTPVFYSPVFFAPIIGFRPMRNDETMEESA